MKIAMMTSWGVHCGIAEFSRQLVDEITKVSGQEVMVLGNRWAPALECLSTPNIHVHLDAFRVESWGETTSRVHCINTKQVLEWLEEWGADVLHIQFQQTFFTIQEMDNFCEQLTIPVVVTFHDNFTLPPHGPFYDAAIVHREEMLSQIQYSTHMELPYEQHTPNVFAFGLGRNKLHAIKSACERAGVNLDYHDSKARWLSKLELEARIKAADAVIMWYDDIPLHDYGVMRTAVAGSAAARLAVSLHRPVLVNLGAWFADLTDEMVIPFGLSTESLEFALREIFHLDRINVNSYSWYASNVLDIYTDITGRHDIYES
jgi:hypothetical protein